MNKIYIFIILLIVFQTYYFVSSGLIKSLSNETALTYEYDLLGDYYQSFEYEETQLNINFTCNKNTNSVVCYSLVTKENMKKAFGYINYCNPLGNCIQNFKLIPPPFIKPEFRPLTRGGPSLVQGFYFNCLPYQYYTLFPSLERVYFLNISSRSFDSSNLFLDYPSGCGFQSFKFTNGLIYEFSYANPIIDSITVKGNNITINGNNFCSEQYQSNITIDGVSISNSQVLKDHSYFNFKYSPTNAKKSSIKIVTSNVTSVDHSFEFPPEINSINSVPTTGGIITINGIRLSSETGLNSNIIVRIGKLGCSNVIKISNEAITCIIGPGSDKNMEVSVTIDGIKSKETLLFNYGVTKVYQQYSIPDRVLNLNGDCLGNISSTLIYIDDKLYKPNDLLIENEKKLSFKIPKEYTSRFILYIIVNGLKSNSISIDISFYASESDIQPSTYGGSNVVFTLYNIIPSNYNQDSNIIIYPEEIKIKGQLNSSSSTSLEVKSFVFNTPQGCGSKLISISIGNQTCNSTLTYESPKLSNCSVSNYGGANGLISCQGSFGNPIFSNNSNIQFSNKEIDPSFSSNYVSFPLSTSYQSGDLIFELCNVKSNIIKINLSPSFEQITPKMNTTGGEILITGVFFDSNTSTTVVCNNNTIPPKFVNNSAITFQISVPGPNDLVCSYNFDNGKNSGDLIVEYPSPIVEKTSNISTDGGSLTIYGNNFYNLPKENILISVGGLVDCLDIIFINISTLTCNLLPYTKTIEPSIFTQTLYLNVTFDSKSGGAPILIYSIDQIGINGSSSIETHNKESVNANNSKRNSFSSIFILFILNILIILLY